MARHQERKSRAGGVTGTALAPGVERRAPQLRGGETRSHCGRSPTGVHLRLRPFPARGGLTVSRI